MIYFIQYYKMFNEFKLDRNIYVNIYFSFNDGKDISQNKNKNIVK